MKQQLGGHGRRRRDRPGPGCAGRAAARRSSVQFNPILLKPGSDHTSQRGAQASGGHRRARDYITHRDRLAGWSPRNWTACGPSMTSCCARAGRPPKSTCAQRIWRTWAGSGGRACPSCGRDIDRRRCARAPVRDRSRSGPAGSGTHRQVHRQQVPRRPPLLAPGLEQLAARSPAAHLRVLPYSDELWLDAEDSVSVAAREVVGMPYGAARQPMAAGGRGATATDLNSTDIKRWPASPASRCAGSSSQRNCPMPTSSSFRSKATVADLQWLRERGLADAIIGHARRGGGARHLRWHADAVPPDRRHPSRARTGAVIPDLLDADVVFAAEKVLRRWGGGPTVWTATKSTTGGSGDARRTPGSRWPASGWASGTRRSSERTGTGCSTTTTSGVPGCGGPRWRPAGTASDPRPTRVTAAATVSSTSRPICCRLISTTSTRCWRC